MIMKTQVILGSQCAMFVCYSCLNIDVSPVSFDPNAMSILDMRPICGTITMAINIEPLCDDGRIDRVMVNPTPWPLYT